MVGLLTTSASCRYTLVLPANGLIQTTEVLGVYWVDKIYRGVAQINDHVNISLYTRKTSVEYTSSSLTDMVTDYARVQSTCSSMADMERQRQQSGFRW
jgi:hypothetical protein